MRAPAARPGRAGPRRWRGRPPRAPPDRHRTAPTDRGRSDRAPRPRPRAPPLRAGPTVPARPARPRPSAPSRPAPRPASSASRSWSLAGDVSSRSASTTASARSGGKSVVADGTGSAGSAGQTLERGMPRKTGSIVPVWMARARPERRRASLGRPRAERRLGRDDQCHDRVAAAGERLAGRFSPTDQVAGPPANLGQVDPGGRVERSAPGQHLEFRPREGQGAEPKMETRQVEGDVPGFAGIRFGFRRRLGCRFLDDGGCRFGFRRRLERGCRFGLRRRLERGYSVRPPLPARTPASGSADAAAGSGSGGSGAASGSIGASGSNSASG